MRRVLLGVAAVAAMALVPQSTSAQSGADLTLVHGIQGATVDVAVDGTVVIDNFVPGSLANISSFAGQTLNNVTLTEDGTGTVLIGPIAQLEMPATGSHSVVAHLDASGDPTITTFENDTDEVASGQARVTLRHVAEIGAVDLIIADQRPVVGATNGQSAELDLPVGQLTDAQIAPTGDVAIEQIATLDLAANTNTIIHVVGSQADDTIDFVVQVVELPAPAAATTTTTAGATTTTVAGATTTTVVPTAVNTGSPLDSGSGVTLAAIAIGGLLLAGGAMLARRHV